MATVNGRLLNGSSTPDPSNTSGGDDFIGGAELTPIPWLNVATMASYLAGERPYVSDLRTESTSLIDGPNGAGSLETVTVSINGISSRNRDDLHSRAERIGAGPLSSHPTHENLHPHPHQNGTAPPSTIEDVSGAELMEEEDDDEEGLEVEERAIARGPDVIGMEDIGPQGPNDAQTFAVDAHPERTRHEDPFVAHQGEQRPRQRDDDDDDDDGRGADISEEATRRNPDPPDQDHDQHQNLRTYRERDREREGEEEETNKEVASSSRSNNNDDVVPDPSTASSFSSTSSSSSS